MESGAHLSECGKPEREIIPTQTKIHSSASPRFPAAYLNKSHEIPNPQFMVCPRLLCICIISGLYNVASGQRLSSTMICIRYM